jgi:HD-GYP domain-containing protein (c-di-GMP phosphodiesterase class II)
VDEALEELHRCCSTQFDPEIVKAFARSLGNLGDPRLSPTMDEPAHQFREIR